MTRARFSGGGSLDGAETSFANCVTSVTTAGGSHYVLDDSGTFTFAGFGGTGEIMAEIIRRQHDDEQLYREAVAAARKATTCRQCGETYLGSAYAVHRDGERCLAGDAYGQLERVDNAVWKLAGSDVGR